MNCGEETKEKKCIEIKSYETAVVSSLCSTRHRDVPVLGKGQTDRLHYRDTSAGIS